MTDDLVTRLLSQANLSHSLNETGLEQLFREAADALERANTYWDHETRRANDLEAKLAAAEIVGNVYEHTIANWRARAEKAEAEAAALREALLEVKKQVPTAEEADQLPPLAWASRMALCDMAADEALAQPGPGAALLDRVKKLEAVAEAANALKRNHKGIEGGWLFALNNALAALEKKP